MKLETIKISSKRAQEKPLPRPFPLPVNFQATIMEGLKKGVLVGRTRTKFVTAIAEAIFQHKSRALKEEYEEVALQAVKRWPFLGRHVRTMQASVADSSLSDHATMHNYNYNYNNGFSCDVLSIPLNHICRKYLHKTSNCV